MIQWGQTMSDKKRCERGLGGHGEYDKVLDNGYAEIVMRLTNFLLLLSFESENFRACRSFIEDEGPLREAQDDHDDLTFLFYFYFIIILLLLTTGRYMAIAEDNP